MALIRRVFVVCSLLVPAIAFAQSSDGTGVPVVFFSIFGPNGSELQRFYADVFEWKTTPGGDVTVKVTSQLMGTVGQGAPETLIYIGVADVTATLQKVVARGSADSIELERLFPDLAFLIPERQKDLQPID